jgi:hypothetical protein
MSMRVHKRKGFGLFSADQSSDEMARYIELQRHARSVLGEAAWSTVRTYGKLTAGGNSGSYVSGIGVDEARALVDALASGHVIAIHLMHRHHPGQHENSSLSFHSGRLIMHFRDRCEFA